ncbi:tagaturonate reductase [Chitinophaga skermanii]|uniref:Tagaturonate reductase n=1 Tax=Chitinophaga skermanii TaxID=331697 RepID=A0A327RAU4_9BACT|nr:tagaturonate reductase [Chitinophaga skermanii]RAJ11047.1 tagaturonate reductase [Chitinophaga skermanii]
MLPVLSKDFILKHPQYKVTPELFEYPERILQFGTGVLLRGLVDYLVDKANKQQIFKGRIVVVKSTGGDTQEFDVQNSLYTTNIKGVSQNQLVDGYLVNASISRVLQSVAKWSEVLEAANQPTMQVIISNTTEVGIQYTPESIFEGVPNSFPAKLLAVLYSRFTHYKGAADKGFVIVPTELVVDNGLLLKETLMKLAAYNELPADFQLWMVNANTFCSSLVDRIVPGKPKELEPLWNHTGYQDNLWITTEPYLLWAIEGDEKVKKVLSFHQADERMRILPVITPFREQKLRILNGSHTAAAATGYLLGLQTVHDCMKNDTMKGFFQTVILKEITPTLKDIVPGVETFANEVLERFANPFIVHNLQNITFQQSTKTNARNALTIVRYYEQFGHLPAMLCLGFATSLFYLNPVLKEGGKFLGRFNETLYEIKDDNAVVFANCWTDVNDVTELPQLQHLVEQVCKLLFNEELRALPGFTLLVAAHLHGMFTQTPNAYLSQFINDHQTV